MLQGCSLGQLSSGQQGCSRALPSSQLVPTVGECSTHGCGCKAVGEERRAAAVAAGGANHQLQCNAIQHVIVVETCKRAVEPGVAEAWVVPGYQQSSWK